MTMKCLLEIMQKFVYVLLFMRMFCEAGVYGETSISWPPSMLITVILQIH